MCASTRAEWRRDHEDEPAGAGAEQALGLDGVEAPVAQRVAAQQAPVASTRPRSMPNSLIAWTA